MKFMQCAHCDISRDAPPWVDGNVQVWSRGGEISIKDGRKRYVECDLVSSFLPVLYWTDTAVYLIQLCPDVRRPSHQPNPLGRCSDLLLLVLLRRKESEAGHKSSSCTSHGYLKELLQTCSDAPVLYPQSDIVELECARSSCCSTYTSSVSVLLLVAAIWLCLSVW